MGKREDADFQSLVGVDIVKEFVNGRSERTDDRKTISGLQTGVPVWILSRGHDHRGATFFDEDERVVWLMAYGRHRSGNPDDFYRYCPELDTEDRLFPDEVDYQALFDDRGERFVDGLMIEAPLCLKRAREEGREIRATLGGNFGAGVAVEVADDLEQTIIAVAADSLDGDRVPLVLAAFHADGEWYDASRLPSRELLPGEIAFAHIHEAENEAEDSGGD